MRAIRLASIAVLSLGLLSSCLHPHPHGLPPGQVKHALDVGGAKSITVHAPGKHKLR